MKTGIIALCLSLAALGLAGFAVAENMGSDNGETEVAASPTWSAEECASARRTRTLCVMTEQGCGDVGILQIAINDNCP